jgi:ElaA protein
VEWQLKKFKQLDVDELFELLKLRVDVFVVEQTCPYHEIDEIDRHPDTLHLMGRKKEDGKLVAYLRILPPGLNFIQTSLGRVVVAKENRGEGISNTMVKKALKIIEHTWPGNNIKIGAQVYLKQFYASHGFKPVSKEYLEDGIPHIDMLRKCI